MLKDRNIDRKTEISVIVAIRNEEIFIEKCIVSLLNQVFPKEKFEILIVDGMSEDNTPQILNRLLRKFPEVIRVFDNPKRKQAAGRNIGIREAKGNILWMFDGHAFADPHYLSTISTILKNQPEVGAVGGTHEAPHDENLIGRVISDVQRTFLGGAGSSYYLVKDDRYVETVAFTAYRKEVIEAVGMYNESFVTGEDLELNYRVTRAGFKILQSNRARTYYYRKHNSIFKFFQRMIKYGIWRMIFTKKYPASFRFIFLFPLILLTVTCLAPLSIIFQLPISHFILWGLVSYLCVLFFQSVQISMGNRDYRFLISYLLFIVEHYGLAVGMMIGLFRRVPATNLTNYS